MGDKLIVYHTGSDVLKEPSYDFISKSVSGREHHFDFGRGFYVTTNKLTAIRWNIQKYDKLGVINKYELDLSKLRGYTFKPNLSWLYFVLYNRELLSDLNIEIDKNDLDTILAFDYISGDIADDALFKTVDKLRTGQRTEKEVLELICCAQLGTQITLKSENSFKALKYLSTASVHMDELVEADVCNSRIKTSIKQLERKFDNNRKTKKVSFFD